jgi:oxygen-independent coproporphyrinogen-3 oxidase
VARRQGRPLTPHVNPRGEPGAKYEVRSTKYEEGEREDRRGASGALGLYLHIPFCQSICSYCNFNRGLFDEGLKARYVRALAREIELAGNGAVADTIFFGGGTPSLLEPGEVAGLIDACRQAFDVAADAEVTLESNPETVTPGRIEQFLRAGVTRFSFGAQSFDDGELRRLGRVHDAGRIGEAVAAARSAGASNLNLDLMFWLPGQSLESWLASVDRAVALGPDHVSFYLLELYPNAPLQESMARATVAAGTHARDWVQTSDDVAADMYLHALDRFDAAGYRQYEISNVARPGFESRHNLKYWTAGRWLGAGCGAHSTLGEARWQNVAGVTDYVDRIETGRSVRLAVRQRDAEERFEEALFTGMRLTEGIDGASFVRQFGIDPWQRYGERLSEAEQAGLVWHSGHTFGLTRPGMLVANEVLVTFV